MVRVVLLCWEARGREAGLAVPDVARGSLSQVGEGALALDVAVAAGSSHLKKGGEACKGLRVIITMLEIELSPVYVCINNTHVLSRASVCLRAVN